MDSIPAEFIRSCKNTLTETITIALNHIIEHRDFPQTWASGIRSAVFKNGQRCQVNNFRGITILPMMEKIFETIVYRRLTFVNDTFDGTDRYNGGFLHGSLTSDNLFVLNGLIEKQMLLGKSLLVCFVDFTKAFDMITQWAKRALAIRAGERVTTHIDKERQIAASRSYRACKQRKERAYTKKCVNEIRHAFHNDRGSLWRVLGNISNASSAVNSETSDSEFYHHFKDMSIPRPPDDCDTNYEEAAIAFINRYDSSAKIAGNSHTGTLMEEIINSNFTCDEIECAIDALKSHKSPGM